MIATSRYATIAVLASALLACSSRSGRTPDSMSPKPDAPALRPASGTEVPRSCSDQFVLLDKNGDGRVSIGEFLCRPQPCSDPDTLFRVLDRNSDGFLEEHEFCSDSRLGKQPGPRPRSAGAVPERATGS